jgi:CDP-paratose 2-epimerase
MKLLITGICGFAGSTLALAWRVADPAVEILGVDSLVRAGSELNRARLRSAGVQVVHGDVRSASDVEALPAADWVIDAAANPSVTAGMDGGAGSRQLVEHNLLGTVNLLEFCRRHRAGFVLLSTSRVYSIAALRALPLGPDADALALRPGAPLPAGVSAAGLDERFPTTGPVSLYGATKLASEALAVDYGSAFGFPVWIDRCGNLAGAGQFGRADQGILAWWINAWLRGRPLRYLGYGGAGHQVRDFLHPQDLVPLLRRQLERGAAQGSPIFNVGGGTDRALSLAQLSRWCERRFGPARASVTGDPSLRALDVPWVVMDAARAASELGWRPATSIEAILEETAAHAERHPDWLEVSG